MPTAETPERVKVPIVDELLLQLVSPMGMLAGYEILAKYRRKLFFAASSGLEHRLLLRYLLVYADKFKTLPGDFAELRSFIEGQEKSEGPLDELKELAAIRREDVLWHYESLEVLADAVYQEAITKRHQWVAEKYQRIVTVGYTDHTPQQRFWKGVEDAQEFMRKEWAALPDEDQQEEEPEESPAGVRYPELQFPAEALKEGQFKDLVDKACEGGLSPGLVAPAIMAYASAIPKADSHDGARINLYVCLLALVGAGKDTAMDRARQVLGLDEASSERIFTAYTPSGERSIATLIGDNPPTKNDPVVRPGPRRHCIVTYELEDTLAKSRGETSSVLQAMQWFYDHNQKVFSDSKTRQQQTVDCRLSWLTALPIGTGQINADQFRRAFGESTSHGIASRFLFGFAEESFDRRKSRNWTVPFDFHHFTTTRKIDGSALGGEASLVTEETRIESTITQIFLRKVEGFAPGVEEQYLAWKPTPDHTGRDTYHILKVAVITALLNDHKQITQQDWDFAVAFMAWQGQIRTVFALGKSVKVGQGEFNEIVMAEATNRTLRMMEGKSTHKKNYKVVQEDGETHYYLRWKGMSVDNKWMKYGYDVQKTIDSLARGGELAYLEEFEPSSDGLRDKTSGNTSWVRLVANPYKQEVPGKGGKAVRG